MPEYHFPKDKDYVFVVADIKESYGGLTTAMLHRAKLFSEKGQVPIRILTFNFNPNYSLIRQALTDDQVINDHITILNMYEYFSGYSDKENNTVSQVPKIIAEDGYTVEKIGKRNDYRYFKNGLLIKYKSFDPHKGHLKYVDYFNNQLVKTMREEYGQNGIKRRVTYFDHIAGQKRQELYFDQKGRCYLTKWFKTDDHNKVSSLDTICWFDEHSEVKQIFSSDLEMRCYWMNELIQNHETFIFADTRSTDPSVMKLKGKHLYKIFITHSIHVRPPFEAYSDIRNGNKPVLNQAGEPDAIVYLTQAQKRDVEYRFGKRNNLFTIPHGYHGPEFYPDFSKRDLKKAVVVSRYHKDKQLDHIIKAFARVLEFHSDVKLEIYGFGPEEKHLQHLIEELEIEQYVTLMGETDQPSGVFTSGAFSVVTSKFEGFGLTILESLAHGCPVLAYDIKYGPSDLIYHQVNGVLIPPNQQKTLTETMIDLFSRPKKLKKMSQAAFANSQNFNDDAFLKRWEALLQTTILQRAQRNQLSGIDFFLSRSEWGSTSLGVYKVNGSLTIHGDFPMHTVKGLLIQFKVQHRETKEYFYWQADVKNDESLSKWNVNGSFPIFQMYDNHELPKGAWDIFITITWHNSYFEKRIGYQKSQEAEIDKSSIKTPRNLVIQPYYTHPHGNLTFHVKDNIVQKIIKNRSQAFNKLAEWINQRPS